MTDSSTNPYPGLRTFEYSENHLFFGRDGQAQEVADKMQQSHFVAVVGTSGSGKSSLVRAGLLPFLHGGKVYQTGSHWQIAVMRPGEAPIRNLAKALTYPESFDSENDQRQKDETRIGITDSMLRRSGVGILDFFRNADFAQDENLLIVVDQFEEIFRFQDKLGVQDSDEAIAFVKLLLAAAGDPEFPIYVVITMRSDFLGDCAEFRDLPEAINKGQYLIPRLTRDQLRQAIEAPAMVYDAEISPVLVNRLLNDLEQEQNQSADLRERMLRDRLPVLQHVLMRMWNRWEALETPDEPIELAQYEDPAIGGMSRALSNHADEAYDELTETQKRIAERMFKCLTETDSEGRQIRRVTSLQELCSVTRVDRADMIAVIDTFRREGRTFVMPPPHVELTDDTKIDISHESLIRNWELLKKWVKEEAEDAWQYRRLYEDAHLWGANEASFWGGRVLEIALDWRDQFGPTPDWAARYQFLTDEEKHSLAEAGRVSPESESKLHREIVDDHFGESMTFLDASAKEEERIKAEKEFYVTSLERQTRNARIATFVSLGLMVAAIISSVIAFSMWGRASAATSKAEDALVETARLLEEVTKAKTSEKEQRELAEQREREAVELAQRRLEAEQVADVERKKAEAAAKRAEEEAKKNLKLASDNAEIAATLETKLRELGVKNAQALANLNGLVSFEKEEFDDAEKNFQNLLLDPLDLVKTTSEQKTDADRAEIDYNWWANHNLATIYYKQDKFEKAVTYYNAALRTLGYETTSALEPVAGKSASVVATLHRYADFYRERAVAAAKDIRGRSLAQENNKSAAGIYQNLIAFLDRVCRPDAKEGCKKNTLYQAGIEIELGETQADLAQYEPNNPTQFENSAASFQRAYGHYQTFDKDDKNNLTRKARKAWSRAVSIQPTNNSFTIQQKELRIREINKKVLDGDPVDLDNADVYGDLARAYDTERNVERRKYDNETARYRAALPPEIQKKINTATNTNAYDYDDEEQWASNTASNTSQAYVANVASVRRSETALFEHLTPEQKEVLGAVRKKITDYQARRDKYSSVQSALTRSVDTPDLRWMEIFPDPETTTQILKSVTAAEAYERAGECDLSNRIFTQLKERKKREGPFNALLFASVELLAHDTERNPTTSGEYLSYFRSALASDKTDEFLRKLETNASSGPVPSDVREAPFAFVEAIASHFASMKNYDTSREILKLSIHKLQVFEQRFSGLEQPPRGSYVARLYVMLARVLEAEAEASGNQSLKSKLLGEVRQAYDEAIKRDVSKTREAEADPDGFYSPGFRYKSLLADFFERQGDEENMLKIYSELEPSIDSFVKDKTPETALRKGLPSRMYVRILKKLGDVEQTARRTARALEYYDRAISIMETLYKNPASGFGVVRVEADSYVTWNDRLTKAFYKDYIELIRASSSARGSDPSTYSDKIQSLSDSETKAPSSEARESFDFTPIRGIGGDCAGPAKN